MATINLTRDKTATIDDDDLLLTIGWHWQAVPTGAGSSGYDRKRRNWYVQGSRVVDGKYEHTYMHILLMGRNFVDHINGDGFDNRRENLRLVTPQQNSANQSIRADRGSSRFKGVYWAKKANKWAACIKKNYHTIGLGAFSDELDAARAYNEAATRIFGEFARLNEI